MTAKARRGKNTLRLFTNGDFSQTFDRQWVVSPRGISCHLVPGSTLSMARFVHNNINSKEVAECLCCAVSPPPILHVMSLSIESPITYSSYDCSNRIHTFMHPRIDTFVDSHIYAYTTHMHIQHRVTHGCIGHPKSWSVVSFRFNYYLSCFKWVVLNNGRLEFTFQSFQVASSNKRTAWTLSKVSPPVCLVQRCH